MSDLIRRGNIARLLLVLILCAAAPFVSAERDAPAGISQPAGLMWNRTGLPAVFPLQVKTPPGQDYFLTLIDADTDEAALAAYIKGGAFFKVLVPPGVFRLRFATGDVWHGEDDLFGPGADTHVFGLQIPLTFETRGLGIKAGHIVNLSERPSGQMAEVTLKDQFICQSFRVVFPSPIYRASETERPQDRLLQRWIWKRPGHASSLDGRFPVPPERPEELHPTFTRPGNDVRSRFCG